MTDETNQTQVDVNAVITCPVCETKQEVVMPIDSLQHYYKCTNQECGSDLSPLEGKDCVFCSYADKPCPQRQTHPEQSEQNLQSLI